ncbi:glutamate synthase conserved region-containing protein [Syntrophus gentianae]|uniref:glutamate synthase (NADPH) n=1 Tax=Syntrophus gentianae TaxID=43775 RepID=A0A1H7Y0Y2_9BACT|nr:glutamate synthase-related protein [Syntrophus gentianae]SEM39534.1 glutamate synthase conserved region-containing protein [Syntrophus gentianae]
MPKKYHISTKATPLDLEYLFKFRITRGENCINCGKCTKVCIYEAHKREIGDPRKMAAPNTAVCRNCFRCIQECPRGALEKSLNQDFLNSDGSYWKSNMLISLWKQAEDGKVPVSGAGYRGPFTGMGFDGMWTDMSEIVRPTRDGIHGREYISTAVELGRKLNHLVFDADGKLLSRIFDTVHLPLPIVFDLPAENLPGNVQAALAKAAAELDTFLILPVAGLTKDFEPYADNIIPLLTHKEIDQYSALLKNARLAALQYDGELLNNYQAVKVKMKGISSAPVIIRIPAGKDVEDTVSQLVHSGAEIIHIVADYCGLEVNGHASSHPRLIKDIIRAVHLRLVSEGIRDEVSLIFSGGIAMAEHVPKAMICGADLTAVDLPLLIALGIRLYEEPEKFLVLPEGLENIPVPILTQRIVNLMGAWHSQLLEVMGAMGIREARRLRGETGRAIFFEEVDEDTFGKLFKNREAVRL